MRPQSFFALLVAVLPLVVESVRVVPHDEIEANVAQGLRLLTLADDADPVWKTEEEKLELKRQHIPFFDVTEVYEDEQKWPALTSLAPLATYPAPSHTSAIKSILTTLSISNMQDDLTTFTAFNNRYYSSSTGAQASDWLLSKVKTVAAGRSDITVSQFKHSFQQSSVIAKVAGSTSGPVTIFGAHMDSINLRNPSSGRAPGADDDGTGTVNLIEALRALVAADFKPTTPLEFHWYAGEEGGLLGSQAIATNYRNNGVSVKAMVQFDMTGYFEPGTQEVISFLTDNVDAGLTSFLKTLVGLHNSIPAVDDRCGYGCSDHASWTKAGYPAALPFEANFQAGNDNPNIHTDRDTTSVSGFSWTHSLEFVKLAVAAAYELTA
ncbi:aminopeptidase [Moniliophthora roreri MCA 2997]|uniref:Peptide hydrolase n=2 Tax=Moniliophthora roreri TaxID=221103 RepID=V2X3G9_MONRO|nr:aminopeptidase [Moniliophthora roreri MCA 2997]